MAVGKITFKLSCRKILGGLVVTNLNQVRAFFCGVFFYKWFVMRIIKAKFNGSVNRILPSFKLPDRFLRNLTPRKCQGAETCNLRIWRDDFCRVNGSMGLLAVGVIKMRSW